MQATLTVLFTDAVASTEALSRLGDERFGVVQDTHLGLLRAAVGERGGREVKSLGDGLMVAFTGAADALACAVTMQQAIDAAQRRGEAGLPLRVGVSAGDVTVAEDGDLQGTAVVEAARLCAAAAAGQVLGTETVRVLAGSRGGHAYTALGPVELKGLAEPVAVVEVGWAPLADDGGLAPVPLPPRLAGVPEWAFVGRTGEVERLDAVWRDVAGGVRVALLSGEPGAGKTRLAQELAGRAHAQGALVLFGRVDEDLAVAYQPFAEALRHYLSSVDESTRDRVLELRGGVLARLVPELVEELPAGQVEAWAIFEGLVDWLAMEAARRPVVLVLDDVHWAAKATLQALMHLVRSDRPSRLLIVVTYRDTELGRAHPLSEVLADLRREDGVERLSVRGLDADGVEAFVQAARGDVLDDAARELAALLSEQTQGNPFFVGQVLRHLVESGAVQEVDGRWVRAEGSGEFIVPEGVREVVGRRVSRLSKQAGELLTVAAVTGPQFDIAIVAEVAGQPIAEALDSLDEALDARLVLEAGSPGLLRFAHALVRQTLEDELSTMRRLHLHQQIGLALERRFGDAESAVADLAHHFAEAAVLGEGERAARYAERAAVQALDQGASEQAVDLFERALDVLPADTDAGGIRRDELYAQLAQCCWVAFDQSRLEAVSHRWLTLGRELDDDVMRANAAAWLAQSFIFRTSPEPADIAAFSEALKVDPWSLDLAGRRRFSLRGTWCATDAPGMRAWLLAEFSFSWAWGVPLDVLADELPERTPLALANEALRLAAESIDPEISDDVRFERLSPLSGDPDANLLLKEAERTVSVGYRMGGGGWVPFGVALARLGRLDELITLTRRMLEIAEQNGDRILQGQAHNQRAIASLLHGRFEDAQDDIEQGLQTLPDQVATQLLHALMTVARLLMLGQAEAAMPIAQLLDSSPAVDSSHLVGVVAAAQGDLATSRSVLEAWHASGRRLPVDSSLPGRLWGLATCAHTVGDRDAAAHLYDHLTPYDGQLLYYGLAFVPASTAFTLGMLAETQGDRGRALAHFSDALAFEERIGATALATRTREALARVS